MRLAIVALLVLVAAAACSTDGDPSPPPRTSALVDGTPTKLDDTLRSLRGKPVVVNYWATWCGPCKSEMPRLVAAAEKYAGRVHFLGVDVQDSAASAADFIRRYKIPFRSLSDPDGDIRDAQKLVGLPETQFYSEDGELAFLHRGEIDADELNEKIEDLLDAAKTGDARSAAPSEIEGVGN
jgi:thiol-disulfide isomerase/thioredoxin